MQASIESFLFINFLLNTLLMGIVAQCAGRFRMIRVLCAAAIATLSGLIAALSENAWPLSLIQLMLLIPLAMLICGDCHVRIWGIHALMLFSGVLLSGGCQNLFAASAQGRIPALISAIGGLGLLYMILFHRRHLRSDWNVEICISVNGRTTCLSALIDTGNRLHEPLSGLPVIIATESVIKNILPNSGYRQVAFGGLGGNGHLECFRPDYIWLVENQHLRRAPDAWVALCPTPLPGGHVALAPSEFASL